MDPAFQNLTSSVENLKSDMAKIGMLVDRLDVTIEKLTEVSSNVSQLLAIQGSRLEFQEKIQAQLQDMIEKRRLETDSALAKLHKKIDDNLDKVQSDVEDIETIISSKIDDITTQNDAQNQRITKIETWMWIILGGSATVAVLIDKLNFSGLF